MKFVFFEIEDWQKSPILEAFPEHNIEFFDYPLSPDTVCNHQDADMVSTFIHSKVTQAVLDEFKNLKLISARSTGYDHIDYEYAKDKQIYVANVPYYGENTVAENTFALILALSRKIFQTYERTEKLNFKIDESIQGFDLKDKTIGIYGLGHIGEYVAKIAHGFSMKIIAYKRTPDPKLTEKYGVEFVDGIDDILTRSDVITFHCPLVPQTKHLVNMENYHKIKKDAIIVNTSRGGLVETQAILRGLEEGYLSGAGLDVFEEELALVDPIALLDPVFRDKHNIEDVIENHLLVARDDVILTPHNAFNSKEAVRRILNTTIENIRKFFAGDSQNIVNPTW
jgi:D-lactate dehydrogenase